MIGKIYTFYYPNSKVTQDKILIAHEDYLTWKNMPDKDTLDKEKKKIFFNTLTKKKEWFTDKSPLFYAIETGILNANGIFPCEVKLK